MTVEGRPMRCRSQAKWGEVAVRVDDESGPVVSIRITEKDLRRWLAEIESQNEVVGLKEGA